MHCEAIKPHISFLDEFCYLKKTLFKNTFRMDRPRRNAAMKALDKMKEIREWEECTESSSLFKTAEKYFEELFASEDKHVRVDEVLASDAEATEEECSDEDEAGYESSFIDDDEESNADSDDWQPRKRVRFSNGDESDVVSGEEEAASGEIDEMESEEDSEVDSDEYSDQSSSLSDEIPSKECEDFADECLNTGETNMKSTTSLTNDTNVANKETSNDHLSLDSDDPPPLTRTDFDPSTQTHDAFIFDFTENEL